MNIATPVADIAGQLLNTTTGVGPAVGTFVQTALPLVVLLGLFFRFKRRSLGA